MARSDASPRRPIRCVIYTRKSSEEGLEQDFNSLHAQREACEAYIKSQAHEGWILVDTPYDDGGFSGGTLNRPALAQLMADIPAGGIDLIVVYKVDRLSRSLADFSKMVERFDAHGVSFVSITQQFNTSTSMGRLTLNVLLSFAQFEREVTGERIRDKLAASKKKGLWMGGHVPLGYNNEGRALVINPTEAETVRHIYRRYLALGSVKRLKEELDQEDIVSKRGRNGSGGLPFSRGALYALLQNPLYIGKIRHKDKVYDGNHEPLIEPGLWTAVQEALKRNRHEQYRRTQAKAPSLLAGLLFDEAGHPLSPTHTRKQSRRYRYYVNQALVQFKQAPPDAVTRVPAHTLESLVEQEIVGLLGNPIGLLQVVAPLGLGATEQESLLARAKKITGDWEASAVPQKIEWLTAMVKTIQLSSTRLTIAYSPVGMTRLLLDDDTNSSDAVYETTIPVNLRRCGVETKLVVENPAASQHLKPHADSVRAIQEALKKALRWNQALLDGEAHSVKAIAEANGVTDRYVSHLLGLALLSPQICQRIFKGDIPHDLTLGTLKGKIPLDWQAQEALFA
jgi:site-specific DNA recombinase